MTGFPSKDYFIIKYCSLYLKKYLISASSNLFHQLQNPPIKFSRKFSNHPLHGKSPFLALRERREGNLGRSIGGIPLRSQHSPVDIIEGALEDGVVLKRKMLTL